MYRILPRLAVLLYIVSISCRAFSADPFEAASCPWEQVLAAPTAAIPTFVVARFSITHGVFTHGVFPVDRDVGINGFGGNMDFPRGFFTNTGAVWNVRGAKLRQHAALFDWSSETKDAIRDLLATIDGPVKVTFNIFPIARFGLFCAR